MTLFKLSSNIVAAIKNYNFDTTFLKTGEEKIKNQPTTSSCYLFSHWWVNTRISDCVWMGEGALKALGDPKAVGTLFGEIRVAHFNVPVRKAMPPVELREELSVSTSE